MLREDLVEPCFPILDLENNYIYHIYLYVALYMLIFKRLEPLA